MPCRAPAARASPWGPVRAPAGAAACSRGCRDTDTRLSAHMSIASTRSRLLWGCLSHSKGCTAWPRLSRPAPKAGPSSLELTPGDTPALAQHPRCQCTEPGGCGTASQPRSAPQPSWVGLPAEPLSWPTSRRAPAPLSLQHHLSLLLPPPTAAREEKGSAEGGGCRAASRGRAFFSEQRQLLSMAAARPASPDCSSVRCGDAAQSPSLLDEHRAISRVTSQLRDGRTGDSPLPPFRPDEKPLPPSAA